MTIKQQGGIFGRNPEFNDLTVSGTTTLSDANVSGDISLGDNDKIILGSGDDIQIYHTGSASFVEEAGGDQLNIRANSVRIEDQSGSRWFQGTGDNAYLYFGNSAKLTTLTNGVRVSGDLIFNTSGNGIDFSATSGTGTSELFDDYEEGTWTPTDASGDGLTFVSPNGVYTKVGRLVMATGFVQYPVTASGTGSKIGGLPFTNINSSARGAGSINHKQVADADTLMPENNATTFFFATSTGSVTTNAQLSNTAIYFGIVYTAS